MINNEEFAKGEWVRKRLFKLDLIDKNLLHYWWMLTIFLDEDCNVVIDDANSSYHLEYKLPMNIINSIKDMIEDNQELIKADVPALYLPYGKKPDDIEDFSGWVYKCSANFENLYPSNQIYKFYYRKVNKKKYDPFLEIQTCTIDYKSYGDLSVEEIENVMDVTGNILKVLEESGVNLKGFNWRYSKQIKLF